MRKINYPKSKARISLQFYWSKDWSCPFNMLCTVQPGKRINDSMSMYKVGMELLDIQYLSKEEKESLASFCRGYINSYDKKIKEIKD